jgi:prepilin-type processing-associated H-X9-DG protein
MEQGALYERYVACADGIAHESGFVLTGLNSLRCPSDTNSKAPNRWSQLSKLNYLACLGDQYQLTALVLPADPAKNTNTRGFFQGQWKYTSFATITDGTSNTIAFGETCNPASYAGLEIKGNVVVISTDGAYVPDVCLTLKKPDGTLNGTGADMERGQSFYAGEPSMTAFQTVLAPNTPNCTRDWDKGIYGVSSNHTGGVNCTYGDGSVHFISDTINNATDGTSGLASASPTSGSSPFGVWGALGTADAGESVTAP